ncbi:protein BIG GRAIN 1-like E [Nicotiana tomentosiformis]|uniref:protein BIG GRAIN 1-like E n=1 Tax=Nicotiana tomentosiformis TaxID=4098 RepID=UPI00051B7E6E|nr:protein BIG GRAIN 1-like E [Nicotiana tomentosiformis]
MSITGIHPETTEKMSKKIIQWRNNDSGEIDVFEAAKYFSGANEEYYNNNNNNKHQSLRGGRMSFDMPIMRNSSLLPTQTTTYIMEKPMIKNKDQKKYKQPSSPGGRLASFLNSLFNQTSSKKKKSSKSSAQSLKDEDESPSGRRKRRSSISHFSFRSSSITTTTTNSSDSKSIYSSSNSGFRTPPPYTPTPTKSYKDFRSFSDQQQVVKYKQAAALQQEVCGDKKSTDYSWLDEKLKLSKNNGERYTKSTNSGLPYEKSKTYNKVVDVDDDDGADSDSSSDLFDLPNIDLDFYSSSGLPVYETTHMDNVKRGAPISSGPI